MSTSSSITAFVLALAFPSIGASQTPSARVHHAQASLADGRVLVTGGENADDLVAWGAGNARALRRDTFVFDPGTGRWSSAGRLSHPRTQHTLVSLLDGTVVVLGGRSGARPDPTVERWDPAANVWRAAGRLAQGRFGHTATALADGRVLVVGGVRDDLGGSLAGGNVLQSVELWDARTQHATAASPLPVALTQHAAVRLDDGRVLVVGGTSWWGGIGPARDPSSSRAFVWNPTSDTWREVGAMSGARAHPAATLLRDGRVLVVGNRVGHDQTECAVTDSDCASHPVHGDVSEVFDPRAETFTPTGATRFPRTGTHQLARLADGRVAVFGVLDGSNGSAPQVVEVWSPETGAWSDHGDLALSGMEGFRVSSLADGRVLVTGAELRPNRAGLLRAASAASVWNPATAPARVPPRESTIAPMALE